MSNKKQQATVLQNGTRSALTMTQTSKTSKISKGNVSSLKIRVNLYFGVLELDCMRLLSFISLFINIAAFTIVAGVTIDMFNITNRSFSKVLIARGDALNTNELLNDIVRVGALSRNNEQVDQWYTHKEQMIDALDRFFYNVDPAVNTTNFNGGSRSGKDMYTLPLMEEIIIHLKNENYNQALDLYQGSKFQNAITTWYRQQSTLFNSVKFDGRDQDALVYNSSTVCLVVVCVSLAIVIPIVVAMTLLNIRSESTLSETLQNSRTLQLMDTMNNTSLTKFFKQACMSQNVLNSYLILSEIIKFNQMKDESEMKSQAQYIYHTFLSEKRNSSLKYVTKSMIASIGKELQDVESNVFNVALFRELELSICEELIPVHRTFMKNIKAM